MPPEIDAEVVSTPADSRPEPGPFPPLFVITWWEWKQPNNWVTTPHWAARCSMFPIDNPLRADEEAAKLVHEGHRNVRIVRIPGDSQ